MSVLLGGVVSGCLYALIALGLVLIYRSSHAVTFALGDVGVAGALLSAATVKGASGLPLPAAVLIGVAAGSVLNLIVYAIAIRLLERRHADVNTMIASTLGMSILIDGILQNHYGFNPYTSSLFSGFAGVKIAGVTVPGPGLAIVISAALAFSILGVVLRYTRTGLKLRMGASNPELTDLSGVRSVPIRLFVWAIAGALAGWAMILFSAYSSVTSYGAAEFLLAAAVAASFGAFKNIPLTVLGAIVVAVAVDLSAQYASVDITALVSLALVVPVFVLRQRRIGASLSRSTGLITGRKHTRAIHQHLGRITVTEIAVVVIVGFGLMFIVDDYWKSLLQQVAAAALIVAGLSISVRYQGRLNLASAGYALIGEYAMAIGSSRGWPIIVSGVIGIAAGACAAGLIALFTVNMEEMYYATITLLFTVAVPELALWLTSWTGGAQGLSVAPGYFGAANIGGVPIIGLISMLLAAAGIAGVILLGRSRAGARTVASVADANLAGGSGIRRRRLIVGGEMTGAGLMVLGGMLFCAAANYVSPTDFGLSASVYLLAALIIGGGWSALGLALAAGIYVVLPAELASLGNWISVLYGGGLVVFILFFPDGLESAVARLYERVSRALPADRTEPQAGRIPVATVPGRPAASRTSGTPQAWNEHTEPYLEVRELSVRFGSVKALSNVSLRCTGMITGIVGPNGAGKSTLLNALSGQIPPAGGSVRFRGSTIDNLSAAARTRHGIGRSFQHPVSVDALTVAESLALAVPARRDGKRPSQVARDIAARFGLNDWLTADMHQLPYGTRKLVDIARAVAAQPQIVLCDEPLSGLDESSRDEMLAILRRLAESGTPVVVVEHDVPRLSRLASDLIVLDLGRVIGQGRPETVLAEPRVVEAFIGTPEPADQGQEGTR